MRIQLHRSPQQPGRHHSPIVKPLAYTIIAFGFLFVAWTSTTQDRRIVVDNKAGSTTNKDNNNKDNNNVAVREKVQCSFYLTDRQTKSYKQCSTCTSQLNQDEVLKRIFDTIGTTNKHCVEFGFGYGNAGTLTLDDFKISKEKITSGLNTHALLAGAGDDDGGHWTPTFFDATVENRNIRLFKKVLTEENIGMAFKDANVPIDVDYVSIDVDSIDVWLFHGLLHSGYRPRVISVEYNANFPLTMPLACEKKWAPWKHSSRIYGSSAASLNIVAEKFGYQVVEIVPYLDIFFIRKDILDTICLEGSLPSLEFLAKGFVGTPVHRDCSKEEVKRLVDFPIALQEGGDTESETRAKQVAMEKVAELNIIFKEKYNQPFCDLTTT